MVVYHHDPEYYSKNNQTRVDNGVILIFMKTKVLNYQIIVEPDNETGTKKPGFTAICPTLGVADDGDTVEQALANVTDAIQVYVDSLVSDGLPVPVELPEKNLITHTQITVSDSIQFA